MSVLSVTYVFKTKHPTITNIYQETALDDIFLYMFFLIFLFYFYVHGCFASMCVHHV